MDAGRPVSYEPGVLLPWLRPIWQAADYACGRRLAAMLPEWIPAYEADERKLPAEARDKLLAVSARTLDRLLEPLRVQGLGRSLTRPGTLLRHQIPIRGSVWEENQAGWLEVDTVALCGGSVAGEFVWMLDGVDYATTWVEMRALWGRGQAGTLAALQDIEACLPFSLLGLDSDNGGEFLNYHVMKWLQQRPRPVFMTRSRSIRRTTTRMWSRRTGPTFGSALATSGTTTPKSSNRSMCWSREPMGSCLISIWPETHVFRSVA